MFHSIDIRFFILGSKQLLRDAYKRIIFNGTVYIDPGLSVVKHLSVIVIINLKLTFYIISEE